MFYEIELQLFPHADSTSKSPARDRPRLETNGRASAVAANDLIQFRLAFNDSSLIFGFDIDGAVAVSDFIQFRLRFGGSI